MAQVSQVLNLKMAERPFEPHIEVLLQLGPFALWTMDCKLSVSSDQNNQSPMYMLDVGLSDNSVETYELQMQAASLVSLS